MVMRVVIAKGYNRALGKALYNCPACFEKKERITQGRGMRGEGQRKGERVQ